MGKLNRSNKNLVLDQLTGDGFNNFTAQLGLQTNNIAATGSYSMGQMISRQRQMLEIIYRQSWIAGQVIDTVAEDMTREGISMYSKISPDHVQEMQSKIDELCIWPALATAIKWGRLYGGAIAVILTQGADYSTPLNPERIGRDRFKGLVVFDRWQIEPSFNDLITEEGPYLGKPKYYQVLPGIETMAGQKIHYTRCIRFDGIEMPYNQKRFDNYWGMSVVERLLDRLMAFDSATQGTAQLVYKAYLRVVQIEGLRIALAAGGKQEQAVIKQFQYLRMMQSLEGITLLDKNDNFATHNYSFSGLSDVLIQFGQQISGATGIPLVRLFGQSPAGLNSTGESDLRNYYDHIKKLQKNQLGNGVRQLLGILSMSLHGKPLPDDFEFEFNSLWQLSEPEKATIASSDANAVNTVFTSGILTKKAALKELKQNSHITGRFTNITEDEIKNAVEEPPEHFGAPTGSVEAKPDHDLGIKQLEEQLRAMSAGKAEEEDATVAEGGHLFIASELRERGKAEIEKLESELETIGKPSLAQLEKELRGLNYKNIEAVEKELLAVIGNTKSLEDLSHELEGIGVSNPSIAYLKKVLMGLPTAPVAKKMPVSERGKAFDDAAKSYFGIKDEKAFEEAKHPRAKTGKNAGQFVKKGETAGSGGKLHQDDPRKSDEGNKSTPESEIKRTKTTSSFGEAKRDENGKLVGKNGQPLPAHIQKLVVPPAWRNVLYNEDPAGSMQVYGIDAAGRPQAIYNEKHKKQVDRAKFARINELDKKFGEISSEIENDFTEGSAEYKAKALIAKLIINTGIRPGSTKETAAKVKAYGATTLEARHVVKAEDGLRLQFVGKKGVQNNILVTDKKVAAVLEKLAGKLAPEDRLFGVDYGEVLRYVKHLDGGKFKPKDFRTLLATKTAAAAIDQLPSPKNEKEYKKAVKAVAKTVSSKLGNTPTVALQSYIHPSVFAKWRMESGV